MSDKSKHEEISEATITLAADTLTGDIASFLIDRLRGYECAFRYMSEDQQASAIEDAMRAAAHLVGRAVSIIAADGRDTIPVSVKKVAHDGDKIQVTMEVSKFSELRHQLFDAAGCAAHLTVADPAKYEGGEGPKPEPDQGELPATQAA
jgi:hypothetical protein